MLDQFQGIVVHFRSQCVVRFEIIHHHSQHTYRQIQKGLSRVCQKNFVGRRSSHLIFARAFARKDCPGGLHNKLTILLCSNICSYSTREHLSVGVREGRTRVHRMWTARRPSGGGHLYTSWGQLQLGAATYELRSWKNLVTAQVYITSLQICAIFTKIKIFFVYFAN